MKPEHFRDHIMALVPSWECIIGRLPEQPDNVIVVTPFGGDGTDNLLARPSIQVLVRGTRSGYSAAFDVANAIHDDLANRTGTIGQGSYQSVYANQSPTQVDFDKSERPTFVCNFSIVEDRP